MKYLVIDRARNSENVYMLSIIDEYDLQEFLDDEERNGKQEEETPQSENLETDQSLATVNEDNQSDNDT